MPAASVTHERWNRRMEVEYTHARWNRPMEVEDACTQFADSDVYASGKCDARKME